MARRRATEETDRPGTVLYDHILAKLKPDREITSGEFLKRAFTFPQIERIKIQKFAGGTWNFAEDVDNVGPGFSPDALEQTLREKYGPWRFRLLVIANGEIITQHLVNLDGWQENEARSAASLPSRPVLSQNSKPVGAGATSELLAAAQERIQIENTTRLLHGLDQDRRESAVATDLGPMKMMAEMMTGMMAMMKEAMSISRTGHPSTDNDRFTQYLTDEIKFMREQLSKPAQTRDADALTKTVEAIDGILNKTLGTSIAEMLTNTPKTEAGGWAATVQGIIEGVKPYLPDIMMMAKTAVPQPPRAPARVIPFPTPTPPVGATPGPVPPPTAPQSEEDEMPAGANPVYVEIINLLIDALRSKNFETIDAILENPPLQGRIVIRPNVAAASYAIMFSSADPRFRELQTEIAAYQDYLNTPPDDDPNAA